MPNKPGLTKAQYAAALAREQAARAKPTDILAALTADCTGEALRPDDITISRVRAALGRHKSDATIRRMIMMRVRAGELAMVERCYDAEINRYVTAYRVPALPPAPVRHMRCPHCRESTPRTPPVCVNCGGDTRRRKS